MKKFQLFNKLINIINKAFDSCDFYLNNYNAVLT
jgi:hypothetical protein